MSPCRMISLTLNSNSAPTRQIPYSHRVEAATSNLGCHHRALSSVPMLPITLHKWHRFSSYDKRVPPEVDARLILAHHIKP
mmetsp:Transcript_54185/g.121503  ORF Transcript_54185/g.121503 Transcript_54185/m.121503 type:complete len:81 (-) Transcript_54185:701-943(-)